MRIIICIAVLTVLNSCNVHKKTMNEIMKISSMWSIDSCGERGYRSAIVDYLYQEKQIDFVGTEEEVILALFPKANSIDTYKNKNKVVYSYIVEGYNDCRLPSESVLKSMIIEIDLSTHLVSKAMWFIH